MCGWALTVCQFDGIIIRKQIRATIKSHQLFEREPMRHTLFAAFAVILVLASSAVYASELENNAVVCRQAEFVSTSIPEALKKDLDFEKSGEVDDSGDTAYFMLTDALISQGACFESHHEELFFIGETKKWCLDDTTCFTIGEVQAKLPEEAGNLFINAYAITRSPDKNKSDQPTAVASTTLPSLSCKEKVGQANMFTVPDGPC